MSEEITVVAFLKAKPGAEQQVADAMKACIAPTLTEESNLSYVPQQDQDDPQTFVFVERWTSRQGLNDHMETPHFKTLIASVQGLLEAPPAVHVLKPLTAL
ncbi:MULTISPECIES: putative quinol monooxygenase [Acetobacter]|uniref:Antibiotic biosynthesis monooxygenase n=1 Tax=Acetobacter persici TaxID=1076596 RepID=A0A1U9LFQ7_9PROT|nr:MULTISPECIES: putative quinol monooxygenase [Acetobacter]AQT05217.1 antibiotic biosynthesis monooxygenase [Acetobacter persici]MBS1000218.1 antibiotic biosynthesis monooxygenase [Acetobacter persici]MBS1015637.1 antibiotic biosynthesis monooxygenase [Acetobacter persici]MCG0999106.1 antibiotic biosynthesis monooxygenase [Acetobacter persici]